MDESYRTIASASAAAHHAAAIKIPTASAVTLAHGGKESQIRFSTAFLFAVWITTHLPDRY